MSRTISKLHNALQLDGRVETPDTTEVTVLFADTRGVVLAYGATVPTDGESGFATGCMFVDTDGGVNVTMYVNDGDATSCDFNLGLGGTGDITSVIAGTGLSGGATSGAATINYDGSHVVAYAGTKTTAGGAAAEDLAVTGVTGTDLAFVVIKDNGTNNVTLLQAVAGTDKITATFSADPGNDCVVTYQVLRAAA